MREFVLNVEAGKAIEIGTHVRFLRMDRMGGTGVVKGILSSKGKVAEVDVLPDDEYALVTVVLRRGDLIWPEAVSR